MSKKGRNEPGAGLPGIEGLLLRFGIAPVAFFRLRSQVQATRQFGKLGAWFVETANGVSEEQLHRSIEISRPRGLEASSCNWSLAMVLEHLVITGEIFADISYALTNERIPDVIIDTAAVKPTGQTQDPIGDFKEFAEDFIIRASKFKFNEATQKHPHPWFGNLSAVKWHALNVIHLQAHKIQAERILAQLET